MLTIVKSVFMIIVLFTTTQTLYAQTISDSTAHANSEKLPATQPHVKPQPKPKGPKPIHRELSIGGRLNSNGWGIVINRNTVKSKDLKQSDFFYKFNIWELAFDETKDPRENKTSSTDQSGKSSSFIYGKINNFYTLKLGLGGSKMIAGKPESGTVAIHWVLCSGFSAGLQKPYYINAAYNGVVQPIKYTEDTKDAFLDINGITGNAGFSKGLSEIKLIPGLFLKTGFHFDFATNRKNLFAVEVGLNGEYYGDKVQIMALQEGTPYFYNLYVTLQFGKRW